MLRVRADVPTAWSTHLAHTVGEDLRHREGALRHERRICTTARDTEPVDTSGVTRDVPVTEIHTQKIRVGPSWNVIGGSTADHAAGEAGAGWCSPCGPLPDGRSGEARNTGDLGVTLSSVDEGSNICNALRRVHARSVLPTTIRPRPARVRESADLKASKAFVRKDVRVRIPPRARPAGRHPEE